VGPMGFVFPGQGSHYVGMGQDLWESEPAARAVLQRGDDVLGFPLTRLMFEGPADELTATENQQPAIVAHSAACLAVLETNGLGPQVVAGHSLGEYSALIAARVLSADQALKLVRKRGELMARAEGGAMAAILGADPQTVEDVCRASRKVGTVGIANHNCPGQLVITGEAEAVGVASQLAKEAGAKRVVPLRVTGAFHSPLMAEPGRQLRRVLDGVEFGEAAVPVVSNVDAQPHTAAGEIREGLARQIVSPVLWEQSISAVAAGGITTFIEVGPGAVLSGLIRRIVPEAQVYCAGKAEQLRALCE